MNQKLNYPDLFSTTKANFLIISWEQGENHDWIQYDFICENCWYVWYFFHRNRNNSKRLSLFNNYNYLSSIFKSDSNIYHKNHFNITVYHFVCHLFPNHHPWFETKSFAILKTTFQLILKKLWKEHFTSSNAVNSKKYLSYLPLFLKNKNQNEIIE